MKGVPTGFYDYEGAVLWNYWVGKQWDHTRLRLRRLMPNLDFVVVREWQARGSLHLHVLLRVPRSEAVSDKLIEQTAQSTETSIAVPGGRSWVMQWGAQVRCETVHADGKDAADTARTIGYMAKTLTYSAKSFTDSIRARQDDVHPLYEAHLSKLDAAARRMRCGKCGWLAGHRCKAMAHRQFGARASLVSVSRETLDRPGWSLTGITRRTQKDARRAWAVANDRALAPEPRGSDPIEIELPKPHKVPHQINGTAADGVGIDAARDMLHQYRSRVRASQNGKADGLVARIRMRIEQMVLIACNKSKPPGAHKPGST
jgi:hypothetical protein